MLIDCSSCGATNRLPTRRLPDGPKCGQCHRKLSLSAPVAVASEADFHELVDQNRLPVLVDFWAPWCGPCRMISPEVEKIAMARAGSLVVAKVNTDELPALGARFGVQGIPTLVLLVDGREQRRVSGLMPAAALERQLGL